MELTEQTLLNTGLLCVRCKKNGKPRRALRLENMTGLHSTIGLLTTHSEVQTRKKNRMRSVTRIRRWRRRRREPKCNNRNVLLIIIRSFSSTGITYWTISTSLLVYRWPVCPHRARPSHSQLYLVEMQSWSINLIKQIERLRRYVFIRLGGKLRNDTRTGRSDKLKEWLETCPSCRKLSRAHRKTNGNCFFSLFGFCNDLIRTPVPGVPGNSSTLPFRIPQTYMSVYRRTNLAQN